MVARTYCNYCFMYHSMLAVIILLAIKTRGNNIFIVLGAVVGLLAVLFYVVSYKRMMAYVESCAYQNTDNEIDNKNK